MKKTEEKDPKAFMKPKPDGKHPDEEPSEKSEKSEEQKKIDELTDLLKRTQADFINFRNRVEKENKQSQEYAVADFFRKLLPVLDSFDMAFKNSKDSEKFKKGIELVYAQVLELVKQEGLSPIDCLGRKFDPYKHEVLLKESSDKEEDTILEELQKGYMFKERILRHSKVKVSK